MKDNLRYRALRHRKERSFALLGKVAAFSSMLFLAGFLGAIIVIGIGGLQEARLRLDVQVPQEAEAGLDAYRLAINASLYEFLDVHERAQKRSARKLLSVAADASLRDAVDARKAHGSRISIWLPASALVDDTLNGRIDVDNPHSYRILSQEQRDFMARLEDLE